MKYKIIQVTTFSRCGAAHCCSTSSDAMTGPKVDRLARTSPGPSLGTVSVQWPSQAQAMHKSSTWLGTYHKDFLMNFIEFSLNFN